MKVLCDRRGERVTEDQRLRLGEIRFRPDTDRAEMSSDTWQLIQNDESLARSYTIARSRALRKGRSSSMMNLISSEQRRQEDALATLESDVSSLLSALHAITDPSDFASSDLLQRRRAAKSLLLQVRARVEKVGARFEVIDELLESKVLT